MTQKYSPLIIFPVFVLIVVLVGIVYAIDTQNKFTNQALSQVHIAPDETDPPPSSPPTTQVAEELNPPLSELVYPESVIISSSPNAIRLETTAETQTITDWYKDKIKSLNFESKSSVAVSKNGNIENRMIGEKAQEHVYIEIKKPNGFLKTSVNIEITK